MKLQLLFLAASLLSAGVAQAKLNVVATIPDFGAIAQIIGGDQVKVSSIAKGTEDSHFVDAKPSFVRLLNQADVLIEGGAELELGWLPPLVNGARNNKIRLGAPGHITLGGYVRLRDVQTGPVDRSMGDLHPLGNPHFWLDPENVLTIARVLAERLAKLDPAHAALFQGNLQQLSQRMKTKTTEWEAALAPYRGTKVVSYHKSFDYFFGQFGLELVGTIESRPGIEPSATYINSLVQRLRESEVKLVIIEPFRPRRTPDYVAQALGAKLLVLPEKVDGHPEAQDPFSLFDYNVRQIAAALKDSP
jgi:ABC-type Zn uptake system ZnuABC Zn-binding protein ZnuA